MSLPTTAALVSLQDTSGAVNNQANGATALITPGGIMKFALQSTQGVSVWTVTLFCPNFPFLHNVPFYWYNGQANLIQIPTPAGAFQCTYTSVVSDGQQSIQSATGQLIGKGSQAIPVQHVARLATNAALAAYTNVGGVLTANANGALASIDSVSAAVGDLVLLGMGAAGADNGLYQVTSLGGASAPFIFTRAPDWPNGGTLLTNTTIEVSEGTLFGGSTWKVMTTGAITVGTTSVAIYPKFSTITTGAAVAGVTPANTANWVFSTSNPVLAVPVTPGGTQGIWRISTQTAGVPGSSSLVATSSSGTDTSTVKLTSINW